MKYILTLIVLALLLAGCGADTNKPDPGVSTWDSATWDSGTWAE